MDAGLLALFRVAKYDDRLQNGRLLRVCARCTTTRCSAISGYRNGERLPCVHVRAMQSGVSLEGNVHTRSRVTSA
jgi:hypothetical protein